MPVSSVIIEAKLALEGVAKKVATPVPKPETPVDIGRPVQFVNVPAEGVPILGVVSTGLVENTMFVLSVPVVPPAFWRYSKAVVETAEAVRNPDPSETMALEAVKPPSTAPVGLGLNLPMTFQSVAEAI